MPIMMRAVITGRLMNSAVRFMPVVFRPLAWTHQCLNSKRRAPASSGYKDISTYATYNMTRKGYREDSISDDFGSMHGIGGCLPAIIFFYQSQAFGDIVFVAERAGE